MYSEWKTAWKSELRKVKVKANNTLHILYLSTGRFSLKAVSMFKPSSFRKIRVKITWDKYYHKLAFCNKKKGFFLLFSFFFFLEQNMNLSAHSAGIFLLGTGNGWVTVGKGLQRKRPNRKSKLTNIFQPLLPLWVTSPNQWPKVYTKIIHFLDAFPAAKELCLSNSVFVLFVRVVVSMEINRRHYFRSNPCGKYAMCIAVSVSELRMYYHCLCPLIICCN